MSNVIRLSILLIVVLFLPISSSSIELRAISGNDEYEVLSALINDLYVNDKVKSIVITTPTCCDTFKMDDPNDEALKKMYREQLSPLSAETLEDFVAQNKQPAALENQFKLKIKYKVVPYVDIEKHFSGIDLERQWEVFYKKYRASAGFVRLSRVGFNKAKDQALVMTGWMAGSLRGEGHYVLLTKQDGSWKVSKKVATWMV